MLTAFTVTGNRTETNFGKPTMSESKRVAQVTQDANIKYTCFYKKIHYRGKKLSKR